MNTGHELALVLARNGRARWVGCLLPFLAMLGGCVSMQNVRVDVKPYLAQPDKRAGSEASRGKVLIDPVRDARRDAVGGLVGEKTTFGKPMGTIETNPVPTAMMASVLKEELVGMGFSIVDSGEQFRVGAQLNKFLVTTPNTALYWDINGDIEIDLSATGQGGERHETRYVATCTDRTYSGPSEELIAAVVSACLKDIGSKLRSDAALSSFLSAR
jgi:uncharacterized lipoprotein YajG